MVCQRWWICSAYFYFTSACWIYPWFHSKYIKQTMYILCTQISGSPKKRVKTAKSCLLYVNIVTLNKKANKGFACKNGLTLIFSKRSDLENIFLIFYHFGIFILHHTCQLYNMWQFSFYKKNFLGLIYLTNLLSVWTVWVVVEH